MVQGFSDAGYTVVGVGRGQAYHADLTSESETTHLFEDIAASHGPPYALIHSVGTWNAQSIASMSLADWDAMMRINLSSTFLCLREAARHMTQGRLVAVAAQQGADAALANQAAYAASKAGVIRLVEAAAREYASRGITAHVLAPSTIHYDPDQSGTVAAEDLVEAALFVCGNAGAATSGSTLRMYGSS